MSEELADLISVQGQAKGQNFIQALLYSLQKPNFGTI
jgi:hypothetical protein